MAQVIAFQKPKAAKPAVVRERGKRADPLEVLRFVGACELGSFNIDHALDRAMATGRWMRREDVDTLKRAREILEREAALNTPVEEVAS